jgi:tetratricopeptide (TPR) repeat protein
MDDPSYDGLKHSGIAMCYHKLGIIEEAEKGYVQSIKTDSKIAETYYNLSILKLEQKNNDSAKKLLEESSRLDKDFTEAQKLLDRIDIQNLPNWFTWWFEERLSKKILGSIILSALIIFTVLGTIIIIGNLLVSTNDISKEEILGLTLTLGLLFLLLFFPSIKRMKIKDLEFDLTSPDPKIVIPELIPPKLRLQV